jgi:hypothetical protein
MKWYLLNILFIVCTGINAQNKKIEKADDFLLKKNYVEALDLYHEIETKLTNPEDLCYANLHRPVPAVENFEKAILFEVDLSSEQNIEYASCMIQTGKYLDAKQFLQDLGYGYIEGILLDKCNFALNNSETNNTIKLYRLNELPANASSGISYYRENLLYVFSHEHQELKSDPGCFGYLGREDKIIASLKDFEFPINSNSPVIDINSNEILFCNNASVLKQTEGGRINDYIGTGGIDNLFIFSKDLNDKKKPIHKLPFNHVDFSCTHPCFSEDGNTMYFASNMLGGYGEFDIYLVKKTENGWGIPQNMGTKINTFLNEGYPYLEGDFLYFSSQGLPGFGGLDIFRYNIETQEVENLGKPINSSFDDFYFIKKTSEGYFVSNRSEDIAKDIIFKFVEK